MAIKLPEAEELPAPNTGTPDVPGMRLPLLGPQVVAEPEICHTFQPKGVNLPLGPIESKFSVRVAVVPMITWADAGVAQCAARTTATIGMGRVCRISVFQLADDAAVPSTQPRPAAGRHRVPGRTVPSWIVAR